MAELFKQSKKKKRVVEAWATKMFIKDKITGRVDIVYGTLVKIVKKLNLKSQDPKKCLNVFRQINQKRSFHSSDFILNFFCNFLKNSPDYIDPSGHFVFYKILCSSNFFGWMSPRCCSRGSPGGWIKNFFFIKLVDIYHRKIHG